MNDINFTDNLTKEKLQIKQWLTISSVAVLVTIFLLMMITTKQLLQINAIKKKIRRHIHKNTELNTILTKKRTLLKEKTKLATQFKTITNLKATPKKRLALLTNIYNALPSTLQLALISLKKDNLGISVLCDNEQEASLFIQKIIDFPSIRTAKITSIQNNNNNNKLIFTIKGLTEKI